ncbi:hypothetical protein [Oceanithermus desulfurans]|uniref:Uncharacterized protein n=2 Tax=Oceanithermus desulfurans TaxID=227924 RepID=A0A511RL83_9DEIN|nr:hypothetical protein [Oceanithermus desulfurans]MBB6030010.1 hypothetical protein [Oceanithermus desulfurans]GEM90424.1 hypothetical protein ODE01S_18580 [Oceanithermus desulfurans NBRC 100063]
MRNLDAHEDYKVDEQQLHRDLTRLLENVNPYVGAATAGCEQS